MWYKLTWMYIWSQKVRPPVTTIEYDFTQSDAGWTASSWTSRDSNWFYRTWDWSDGNIQAPSSMFDNTINKIEIAYSRASTWSWTGIGNNTNYYYWYLSPEIYNGQNIWVHVNNATTLINPWGNPTWDIVWSMDIDSSTTPRTVTHNITGLSSFTDNSWALDYLINNQQFIIRIVNWTASTWDIYIKSVTIS